MLQRANRLRRQGDFRRLYNQGRTAASASLVVKYRTGTALGSRVGIVVGSKVSKLAVERNQLRRRLREIVRACLPQIPQRTDIVIVARPSALKKSFVALQQELIPVLTQVINKKVNR